MNDNFLESVYGYRRIKEELRLIREWYLKSDDLGDRKKLLPKGILFYGDPGEGKTHIVREYSKTFPYEVFVIEGNDDNVQNEVVKIYEKAKNKSTAIVIIDEIDKLIEKDGKLTRIIMAQLDGFDSTHNVLTLATCNNYYSLPEALLREGRFDRHFWLRSCEQKDLEEMILGFSRDAGLKLSNDDIFELSDIFHGYPANTIRAVFNSVSLRYGSECTITDIINTFDFRKTGFIDKDENFIVKKSVAIHEAGHALYIGMYCKTKQFLRIYFPESGGRTVYKDLILDNESEKKSRIETIQLSLAGLVAEDILLGGHDVGCAQDLDQMYELSYRLINKTCINGIDNYCSNELYYVKENLSEYSKKLFEIKTNKFVKKNYKYVKRRLIKFKKELMMVADYIIVHKAINNKQMLELLGWNEKENE